MLEPVDRDVAGAIAGVALDAGKMPVDRGAVMPRVAALGAKLAGQQGIASRGVDDESRLPRLALAIRALGHGPHAARAVVQLDLANAAVLDYGRALLSGTANQDLVEFRAADLVRIGQLFVPCLG